MPDQATINALLRMPVTDRPEAEAFITALHAADLLYHFDDSAVDCLHESNALVSREAAEAIQDRVNACYDAWEASGADMWDDCPIGHALKVLDHTGEED